jgi:hypothetical protein
MYVAATDTIGAIVGTNLERGLPPSFLFLLASIAPVALTDVTFHRLFYVPELHQATFAFGVVNARVLVDHTSLIVCY